MLKRYLSFGVFATIFAAVFYVVWSGQIYSIFQKEVVLSEPDANCDLRARECEMVFDGQKSLALAINTPLADDEKMVFTVKTRGFNDKKLFVEAYGVNMNMGFFKYELEKMGEGIYQGDVLLPSCMSGNMKWRANVISKDENLGTGFIF